MYNGRVARRVPILAKLLGAYLVPAVATFIGFGVVAHYVARRALEDELGRRLTSIAAAAAAQIADENVALLGPGDEETRTYRNLQRRLGELAGETGAARIYVFAKDGTSRADTRPGVPIGERYYALDAWQSELRRVFAGTPAVVGAVPRPRRQLLQVGLRAAARRHAAPIAFAVGVDGAASLYDAAAPASAARCSPSAPPARSPSSRSRSSWRACWCGPSAAWRAPPSASARGDLDDAGAPRDHATRSASSPTRWSRCASSCARATSACR